MSTDRTALIAEFQGFFLGTDDYGRGDLQRQGMLATGPGHPTPGQAAALAVRAARLAEITAALADEPITTTHADLTTADRTALVDEFDEFFLGRKFHRDGMVLATCHGDPAHQPGFTRLAARAARLAALTAALS